MFSISFMRKGMVMVVVSVLGIVLTPQVWGKSRETSPFKVSVNGVQQQVVKFKDISYCNFTTDCQSNIKVEFDQSISSAHVSPIVRNIISDVRGNQAEFTIPSSGWYVVRINNSEKLFILADTPETNIPLPEKRIDILDFVNDNSGRTIQTNQIQKAICHASGSGKILYFPAGIYLTGTLTIPSNTDIYLAQGAVLQATSNREDFPTDKGCKESDHINDKKNYSNNGEYMTFSRMILIDNASNVTIRGRGVIDGNGKVIRGQGRPANLIRIRNSSDVLIDGIILRDPAAWNTHILCSSNIIIKGIKMLNDPTVANTDGFDPDASKNVLIENCFAYCSDDNVAVKTTNNGGNIDNAEAITVRGCVFLTRKSALKVGTETKGIRMGEITFENNDVIECDRAMALYCNDGALFENITFKGNRIENNYPDSRRMLIQFSIKERYGRGKMKNILIQDCHFSLPFPNASAIDGLSDEHCIDGLKIKGCTLSSIPVKSLQDLGIKKTKFVKNISVE